MSQELDGFISFTEGGDSPNSPEYREKLISLAAALGYVEDERMLQAREQAISEDPEGSQFIPNLIAYIDLAQAQVDRGVASGGNADRLALGLGIAMVTIHSATQSEFLGESLDDLMRIVDELEHNGTIDPELANRIRGYFFLVENRPRTGIIIQEDK